MNIIISRRLLIIFSMIFVFLHLFDYTVHSFSCSSYEKSPPFLMDSVTPSVHIILDNSGSMQNFAYRDREVVHNDIIDRDKDDIGYAGYNSTFEYYGYFDSKSYYSYNESDDYFYKDSSTGEWNGNLLNWLIMHRIDIARKVLTGGDYTNSTGSVILEIQENDGASIRDYYHFYDDSSEVEDLNGANRHQTPIDDEFAFVQNPESQSFDIYISDVQNQGQGASAGEEWEISGELRYQDMNMRVKVDQLPTGILDNMAERLRFSLFVYDNDSEGGWDGGEVRNYMGESVTDIKQSINDIFPLTATPLAETLYTVCGYIKQSDENLVQEEHDRGPKYPSDSYETNATVDPFYFPGYGSNVYCSKQNIVLISDGESTADKMIPEFLFDYDNDNNSEDTTDTTDTDESGTSAGTDNLDDIALWAHTNDLRDDLQGNQTVNIYTIFAFGSGYQLMEDAAKNGGFIDKNGDNRPDSSNEYDQDGDGRADNYFTASSGQELESALLKSFSKILNRVSSGSAASVISSSRKGAGAMYQAVFWPSFTDDSGNEVNWIGDVHAFLVDDEGTLYEDNGDIPNSLDSEDSRIQFFYDEDQGRTRVCSGGQEVNGTCNGTVKEINEVDYLWSAAEWLYNVTFPTDNRDYYKGILFGNDHRYLFTWDDSDNDGSVDMGETINFDISSLNSTLCNSTVINWIRGKDQSGMRSRSILIDTNNDGNSDTDITWRLGDIIHSTPTVVGPPAENYDLYWGEDSYTEFYKKYKNRRYMVYFGGNDGILHAINSGFYSSSEDKFYTAYNNSTNTYSDSSNAPDLGAEMWGYVPYNLLPHLKCLTDPDYEHQYFVDLKPRVFDVKIFADDKEHPNGWGTILVCGMRFGGAGVPTEFVSSRFFASSYFVFDITNPESPPTLLGEVTFDDPSDNKSSLALGYTLTTPTVVPVKSGGTIKWFLTLGTGPQNMSGTSQDDPAIAVIPLEQVVDTNNDPNSEFSWRIPGCSSCAPGPNTAGYIEISAADPGCIGTNLVSVDYDFDLFVDIFYFGTVEKKKNKDWDGGLWSLKVEGDTDPGNWAVKERVNTERPVTGAPNVGFYNEHPWIYFGTGKFWTISDKTDKTTQSFFGIQDPKFTSGSYNFNTVSKSNLLDVSDIKVKTDTGDLNCIDGTQSCLPTSSGGETIDTFSGLVDYLTDKSNVDGWYRNLNSTGERVIGQSTLLGGLVTFTSYIPNSDICQAEGTSKLYSVYYITGTPWTEDVFGDQSTGDEYVNFTRDLETGMGTAPSLHVGSEEGAKAFVQTSTGEIVEIEQPNLPIKNVHSGSAGWHTHDIE